MARGNPMARYAPAMRRLPVLALIAAVFVLPATPAGARERFDVKVLAHVPAPGYPALSLVAPDRTIYVGTFTDAAGNTRAPSKELAYLPGGRLNLDPTIEGRAPGAVHGVQVAAI